MIKVLDLVGKRFERLLVLSRSESTPNGQARWLCLCDCGNYTTPTGPSLKTGESKSCGCYNKDRIREMNKTHGHAVGYKSSKTRNSWRGMKERCDNPNNKRYDKYGGRGITYPENWIKLEGFIEDMGECPEGMTLERTDVNISYSKENCKWDTATNQAYNINIKSNNKSGRTGVKESKNGKGWIAYISFKKQFIYLGTFLTFEEAVISRERAELEYYGFNKK